MSLEANKNAHGEQSEIGHVWNRGLRLRYQESGLQFILAPETLASIISNLVVQHNLTLAT